jgi:hypothetical protein
MKRAFEAAAAAVSSSKDTDIIAKLKAVGHRNDLLR